MVLQPERRWWKPGEREKWVRDQETARHRPGSAPGSPGTEQRRIDRVGLQAFHNLMLVLTAV